MTYKATKVDGQALMFCVEADYNGKPVTFNVVCASDESEVNSLVEYHLSFLDNPQPVIAPVQSPSLDPTEKLKRFLTANPDVMALMEAKGA